MTGLNTDDVYCLLCRAGTKKQMSLPGGGMMRRCSSCGFVFANPMSLPLEETELFTRAYNGTESRSGMSIFRLRMLRGEDAKSSHLGSDLMLNSAARKTVALIRAHVPQGSTVFDIGCGVGLFLDAVSRLGYKATGLEVARPMVQLLEKTYPIWYGTIDTIPPGWIEPQVCTSFFTIHHMTDPLGFISTMRTKFPKAMLILAELNVVDHFIRRPWLAKSPFLPPRAYSWWGQRHLQAAMEKAGYQVQAMVINTGMPEFGMPSSLYEALRHRVPRSIFPKLFYYYYSTFRWLGWPWGLIHRFYYGGNILAVGTPK